MQGETFHDFVLKELENERHRRTALDARGTGVVSVSASLATLVAGIAALTTRNPAFEPSTLVVVSALGALVAFVLAAALGIWASRTVAYEVADNATLTRLVTDRWATHDVDALNVVTQINIVTLTSLRSGNGRKARSAILAMVAQLAAIALLAVSATASLSTVL